MRTERQAVRALPPELLDAGPLLCDQPQPLEQPGARVWVASTSQGPRCTALTDDGRLVRGYRVPEGWTRRDDLTLVVEGRCVAAVWVDAAGRWVTDEDGRSVMAPAVGGGVTLHREAQRDDQLVVVDAVPPRLAEVRVEQQTGRETR